MTQRASDVKLPGHEEPIAPVTILDEHGRVLRVVQASEFRRAATSRAGARGLAPGRESRWDAERDVRRLEARRRNPARAMRSTYFAGGDYCEVAGIRKP